MNSVSLVSHNAANGEPSAYKVGGNPVQSQALKIFLIISLLQKLILRVMEVIKMEKEISDFPGYIITSEGKVISYKHKRPIIMRTWY